MKKMIPVYLIQLAILGTILTVGIMLLQKADAITREANAVTRELAAIRKEQLKEPIGGRQLRPGSGIPVYVTNQP